MDLLSRQHFGNCFLLCLLHRLYSVPSLDVEAVTKIVLSRPRLPISFSKRHLPNSYIAFLPYINIPIVLCRP